MRLSPIILPTKDNPLRSPFPDDESEEEESSPSRDDPSAVVSDASMDDSSEEEYGSVAAHDQDTEPEDNGSGEDGDSSLTELSDDSVLANVAASAGVTVEEGQSAPRDVSPPNDNAPPNDDTSPNEVSSPNDVLDTEEAFDDGDDHGSVDKNQFSDLSWPHPPSFVADILRCVKSTQFKAVIIDLRTKKPRGELPLQNIDWKQLDEVLARLKPERIEFHIKRPTRNEAVVAEIESYLPEARRRGAKVVCWFWMWKWGKSKG